MEKCKNCECSHDGSVPGFDIGECSCHRIGGSWIWPIPHEYDEASDEGRHVQS